MWRTQTAVLYVDAQTGLIPIRVSSSSPLKTIQAAVNKANINNQKSVGTKIVVNAGVYRETVKVDPVTGLTAAPLTIRGRAKRARQSSLHRTCLPGGRRPAIFRRLCHQLDADAKHLRTAQRMAVCAADRLAH